MSVARGQPTAWMRGPEAAPALITLITLRPMGGQEGAEAEADPPRRLKPAAANMLDLRIFDTLSICSEWLFLLCL